TRSVSFDHSARLCHGSRSVRVWRVLSVNSPTGCSAETQPVTWDGLRPQRGAPFTATRERAKLKAARASLSITRHGSLSATGDWRLATGDSRLATRDLRLRSPRPGRAVVRGRRSRA